MSRPSLPALALCAGILACSPAPGPVAPTATGDGPVDGDTLVWGIAFDPGNANPLVAPYALSAMIIDLVNPGLARRKVDEGGLSYEPALAEGWTWGEGGLSLTYTLREGLVWEDGTPITSEDVAFTYDLVADPVVASNWHGDTQYIAGVDTPDPRTVVFRFTGPHNPILQQGFTFRGIVPKHVLEGADRATLRGHETARAPVASGAFRIASWAAEDKVVLEPNPRAPAEWRPHLSRIVVRVLPEYSTRILELERGTIDVLSGIEMQDIPRLQAHEGLRLVRMEAHSMQYIGYNLQNPLFQDRRVRQALTQALDRDKLIADLLTVDGVSYGRPCTGTISPTLGAWHNDTVKPLPFDPDAARRLLGEVGFRDSDGDGIRDKDGQPLRFDLAVQNGYGILGRIAVIVQAQWAAIGVDLHIEKIEPTRFSQRAREKDFDAILWSFGNNPKVDPSIQWKTGGQYNWFGYSDSEVDDLIDAGIAATDLAASQAAFREVQARVHAAQPATFLFWGDEVVAVDKRFRDTDMDAFTILRHAEEWYVPAAEQRYR